MLLLLCAIDLSSTSESKAPSALQAGTTRVQYRRRAPKALFGRLLHVCATAVDSGGGGNGDATSCTRIVDVWRLYPSVYKTGGCCCLPFQHFSIVVAS
jgi:hypothetical protein